MASLVVAVLATGAIMWLNLCPRGPLYSWMMGVPVPTVEGPFHYGWPMIAYERYGDRAAERVASRGDILIHGGRSWFPWDVAVDVVVGFLIVVSAGALTEFLVRRRDSKGSCCPCSGPPDL